MDFLELVGLAVLVFYFILRNVGGRTHPQPQPKGRQPQAKGRQPQPSAGDDLADALRQIRRELGFEPPEPEPEPDGRADESDLGVEAAEPVPETPVPKTRLEKVRGPEHVARKQPRSIPKPRPASHYRSEESFEAAETVGTFRQEEAFEAGRPSVAEGVAPAAAVEAAAAEMRQRREGAHPLLERLKRPDEAKEAVILREILGPPKARR